MTLNRSRFDFSTKGFMTEFETLFWIFFRKLFKIFYGPIFFKFVAVNIKKRHRVLVLIFGFFQADIQLKTSLRVCTHIPKS